MTIVDPSPMMITAFLHHIDDAATEGQTIWVDYNEKAAPWFEVVCPCCQGGYKQLVRDIYEADWLTYVLGETAKKVQYIIKRELAYA